MFMIMINVYVSARVPTKSHCKSVAAGMPVGMRRDRLQPELYIARWEVLFSRSFCPGYASYCILCASLKLCLEMKL